MWLLSAVPPKDLCCLYLVGYGLSTEPPCVKWNGYMRGEGRGRGSKEVRWGGTESHDDQGPQPCPGKLKTYLLNRMTSQLWSSGAKHLTSSLLPLAADETGLILMQVITNSEAGRGFSLEVSCTHPSPHCLPPLAAFQVAVRVEKQTCVAVNKQCFPNLYILSV